MAIVQMGNITCPVAMLERYVARTGIACDDERLLFIPICKTIKTEKLRKSGSISYSCLRELFRKKLRELNYYPDKFGLHSLRAGSATAAANNGMPVAPSKGMVAGSPILLKMAMSKIEINSIIADRVITAVHFLCFL